jgi:hypothetical protein
MQCQFFCVNVAVHWSCPSLVSTVPGLRGAIYNTNSIIPLFAALKYDVMFRKTDNILRCYRDVLNAIWPSSFDSHTPSNHVYFILAKDAYEL